MQERQAKRAQPEAAGCRACVSMPYKVSVCPQLKSCKAGMQERQAKRAKLKQEAASAYISADGGGAALDAGKQVCTQLLLCCGACSTAWTAHAHACQSRTAMHTSLPVHLASEHIPFP